MDFIVCKLCLNKVEGSVSQLYLLNIYNKQNQVSVYILALCKCKEKER